MGPDPGGPLRSTPFGSTTRGLYGAEATVLVDNGSLLGNSAALLLRQEGFAVKFLEEPSPTANDIMLSGVRYDGKPKPAAPIPGWIGVAASLAGLKTPEPRTKDSLFVTFRAVPGGYRVFCSLGTETRDSAGALKPSSPAPGYDSFSFAQRLANACGAPAPLPPPTPVPQPSIMEQLFGKPSAGSAGPRVRPRPAPLPSPTPDRRRSNMLYGAPR